MATDLTVVGQAVEFTTLSLAGTVSVALWEILRRFRERRDRRKLAAKLAQASAGHRHPEYETELLKLAAAVKAILACERDAGQDV